MIGGTDVIFPAVGDSATLEGCARIVARYWPQARFEDAITGDKFCRTDDIPFGKLRELFAYSDRAAEAAWDLDNGDAPENSMLYLIVRPNDITLVVDNPGTAEIDSILGTIREFLWKDVQFNYARAA